MRHCRDRVHIAQLSSDHRFDPFPDPRILKRDLGVAKDHHGDRIATICWKADPKVVEIRREREICGIFDCGLHGQVRTRAWQVVADFDGHGLGNQPIRISEGLQHTTGFLRHAGGGNIDPRDLECAGKRLEAGDRSSDHAVYINDAIAVEVPFKLWVQGNAGDHHGACVRLDGQ